MNLSASLQITGSFLVRIIHISEYLNLRKSDPVGRAI